MPCFYFSLVTSTPLLRFSHRCCSILQQHFAVAKLLSNESVYVFSKKVKELLCISKPLENSNKDHCEEHVSKLAKQDQLLAVLLPRIGSELNQPLLRKYNIDSSRSLSVWYFRPKQLYFWMFRFNKYMNLIENYDKLLFYVIKWGVCETKLKLLSSLALKASLQFQICKYFFMFYLFWNNLLSADFYYFFL